jgi:hypothetical protein
MQNANITQECVRGNADGGDPRSFFVSKLTNALRRDISTSKAPPHFAEFLNDTCKPDGPSLSQTSLKANFIVYFAYLLAGRHLEGLVDLSDEDLRFVATEIVNAPRDDTIDQFTKHFFDNTQRGKRYKGEDSIVFLSSLSTHFDSHGGFFQTRNDIRISCYELSPVQTPQGSLHSE